MRNQFPTWGPLLLTFIMLVSIVPAELFSSVNANQPITLTDKDDGSEVTLRKGALLQLRLPAQLGTGFSWRIFKSPSVLETVGAPAIEPQTETANKRVGGNEIQRFTFRTARTGSGVLELEYVRGWEKSARPSKTFRVTITVSE